MKTCVYIGAAIAAVLSVSTVNAQVLGGSVTGAVGGTLSGGMRDMGVTTRGNGALGADLDTGSLRRTTSDVAGHATSRVHNTAEGLHERTRSTLGDVRAKSDVAASTAVSAAASGVDEATAATRQIDAAASAAGSLTSDVSVTGAEAAGALDAANAQQVTTSGPADIGGSANSAVAGALEHGAATNAANGNTAGTSASNGLNLPVTPTLEGSGSSAANGSATASKQGLATNASVEANGSANASLRRP